MRFVDVLVDRVANPSNTGSVNRRQVITVFHRSPRVDFDLATQVQQEHAVGNRFDIESVDCLEFADDLINVSHAGRSHRNVTGDAAVSRVDDIHRPDHSVRFTDRGRDFAKHATSVGVAKTNRRGIRK